MARIKMAGGPWVEIGGEPEPGSEPEPAGDELPVFLRRGRRGEAPWLVVGSGEVSWPAPPRHAGLGVGVAALVGASALLGVVCFCAGYLAGLVRLLGPYSQ